MPTLPFKNSLKAIADRELGFANEISIKGVQSSVSGPNGANLRVICM